MPRSLTPASEKTGFLGRLPDIRPTPFRVVLGISMTIFALLLQWYLVEEGHMQAISALGIFGSVLFGALAYWLAQSFLWFMVVFCPLIATIALAVALWGWFRA